MWEYPRTAGKRISENDNKGDLVNETSGMYLLENADIQSSLYRTKLNHHTYHNLPDKLSVLKPVSRLVFIFPFKFSRWYRDDIFVEKVSPLFISVDCIEG